MMRMYCWVAVMLGSLGCTEGLDGVLETGSSDRGLACPADPRTWDLGTGSASDIARLAPGFFTEGRYRSLQPNVPGLQDIKPAVVDGADGFEFVMGEAPYRVRALTTDAGVALLATPGQCPHLRARERCVDDRMRTVVEPHGRIACLGPVSVQGNHVMIALKGSDEKHKLVFGELLQVEAERGDVSFDIFIPGSDKAAGHVTRNRDDVRDPLPEELFALLKPGGMEKVAARFYKGLEPKRKIPELDARVSKLRVAGARKVVSTYDEPARLVEMIRIHTMTAMPGDDEVFRVVTDRIREVLPRLADTEASVDTFKSAVVAFLFYSKRSSEPLDLTRIEVAYGPKLSTSWAQSPDAQQAFSTMFPKSKYVEELERAHARNLEERREQQARLAQEADDQALWDDVRARADEIATLAYKIRFGQQNFTRTRRNALGLASMQKYREGLVRDAFCPAKRAFVKAKGATEYSRRAAEHCRESAPVDVGIGGAEKTLTAECQAAFATGC